MTYALIQHGEVVSDEGKAAMVPWWSFTKTVIAAAALILVRDNILFLDEPIKGKSYTLRHLLRHEAGLPDYGSLAEYHASVRQRQPPWTVEELMERTNADTLGFVPGRGWAYSNIGYLQVRQLIERSTNESLGSALEHLIFRPLGLSQTRIAEFPKDLFDVNMGEALNYHPGWVYHGLAIGLTCPLQSGQFGSSKVPFK